MGSSGGGDKRMLSAYHKGGRGASIWRWRQQNAISLPRGRPEIPWLRSKSLHLVCASLKKEQSGKKPNIINHFKQERKEWATRLRACNYVKIETGWNFPPVLKIVTCTVQLRKMLMLLCMHLTSVLFLVLAGNSTLTMGFYWSYTLLL